MTRDAYDSLYVCEVLGKQQDRKRFDCGVSVLNDYLARVASQDVKRKAAAVFVMSPTNDKNRIAGFYTLCSTSVELTELPPALAKRLPRYPEVPGILIGRLARDRAFPGDGAEIPNDKHNDRSRSTAALHDRCTPVCKTCVKNTQSVNAGVYTASSCPL